LSWKQRTPVLAAALWWGSLTAIGFVVVPLLFRHLPTPQIAGQMAARLFTAQSWISLGCGLFLLMSLKPNTAESRSGVAPAALILIAGGMLLALLQEFAVAPRIVARENLKLWHGVGSAMYLQQWLCAGAMLWRLSGRHAYESGA
jgi:hypothetical protein